MLKAYEGLRLKVYDDATGKPIKPGTVVKGHPTIGYGRALNKRGITKDEAEALFAADLKKIALEANRGFVWFDKLGCVRRDVILMMIFQMGLNGVKRFRRMCVAIKKEDFEKAAIEMLDSKWARKDSVRRAQELSEMMRTGRYLV